MFCTALIQVYDVIYKGISRFWSTNNVEYSTQHSAV